MRIVASHNLGDVALIESGHVLYQWSWFDSRPTLPLWIGLGLLLILPPKNRKWQAWLILLVPGLTASTRLLQFIPQLGLSNSMDFDLATQLFLSLSFAWAAVWLLAPQLASGGRIRTFCLSFALMLAVGLVGYAAYFGFSIDDSMAPQMAIAWAVLSLALLIAVMLSGACCRANVRTRKIAAWLMLYLPVSTVVCFVLTFSIIILADGGTISDVAASLLAISITAVCAAGCLYAMNLPLLILAGTTDCYRERLRTTVYREKTGEVPLDEETSDGSTTDQDP